MAMVTKTCYSCKKTKSLSEFNRNKCKKDGHQSECKTCKNKYQQTKEYKTIQKRYNQTKKGKYCQKACQRRFHKQNPNYRKEWGQSEKGKAHLQVAAKCFNAHHPNQVKATTVVNHNIRAGKLSRPDTLLCYYCLKPAQQYHHWHGYEKEHWLDVVPVCVPCHQKCNKKIA